MGEREQTQASPPDWSQGAAAWRAAKEETESNEKTMWTTENGCDPIALRSAAPLTVLFGISSFWNELEAVHSKRGAAPFEIHVIGAAYPFEGRADWHLLARKRPS